MSYKSAITHFPQAWQCADRAASASRRAVAVSIFSGVNADIFPGNRSSDLRMARTVRSQAWVPLCSRNASNCASVSSVATVEDSAGMGASQQTVMLCPPGDKTVARQSFTWNITNLQREYLCGLDSQIAAPSRATNLASHQRNNLRVTGEKLGCAFGRRPFIQSLAWQHGGTCTWSSRGPVQARPELTWGHSGQRLPAYAVERYGYEKARRIGVMAAVGGKDKTKIRNATPIEFRDLLLSIARSANTELGSYPGTARNGTGAILTPSRCVARPNLSNHHAPPLVNP